MKKIVESAHGRELTRRDFVGGAVTAAGAIAGAPAFLRGQNLNNRLRIAFIACGGRALASLNELTITPGKVPPAGRGADPNAPVAPHPDEDVTVLCDVNDNAIESASERFPKARRLNDLRRVFDKPDEFDAVVVATAEHTHAFATYLALTHGKHVYCEKPLTYNIWEARLIRETAAKYPKLSTQMGNQGHASGMRRTVKEYLNTGVIGPVREVHVWADRAWGLQDAASAEKFDKPHGFYKGIQIVDRFKEEMTPPSTMHWDLWLGPAPVRPFHETYFPGPRWYRWWDFANGTMSDLGSHDNDVPYTVLDIRQPLTIEAKSPNVPVAHKELAPATMMVVYEYRRLGIRSAAGEAGLASGRQQAARLGAVVGRPRQRVHRRQRHAGQHRQLGQAAARGEVQGLQTAGADAAAIARPLDRVGQLREGAGPRARLELPVFRLDDRSESSWQRRVSHRQEDRVGLQEPPRHQCAGGRAVHQAAVDIARAGKAS